MERRSLTPITKYFISIYVRSGSHPDMYLLQDMNHPSKESLYHT